MNEKLETAQRDKYWDERDNEQKLDALRDQVQQLTYQLGHATFLIDALLRHEHGKQGLVVPLGDSRQRSESYTPNSLRINHDK
jgi:hypothetical protein